MKYYRIRVKEPLSFKRFIIYSFTVVCVKEAAKLLLQYRKRGLCTLEVFDKWS